MSAGRQESRPRPRPGAWSGAAKALAARLRALVDAVGVRVERVRTRRRLGHLSDHMLKDIGVSRAEVAREAQKPFWRK